jgi:hypothetical protein
MLALCMYLVSCALLPKAPKRIVPTTIPELSITILEMPESVCIADSSIIKIATLPGNECLCSIVYYKNQNSLSSVDLESIIANNEGICEWSWYVDEDIMPDKGELRIGVRGFGDLRSLMPQIIEISSCE